MALDLSTLPTDQQIAAIYIGYYDRAGEPDGSTFWENTLEADNGFDLAAIASDFGTQSETLEAHQFFENPTAEEANAFLADLYLNMFNRDIDQDGLDFWAPILTGVIDGETFDSTGDGNDDITEVGDIILAIIQGAQDVEGGDQDRSTILNKILVATEWTNAAEEAGATDAFADLGQETQDSAKSIIAGVTDEGSTVTEAKATIASDFAPEPVPGNDIFLTSATDVNGMPNQMTGEVLEATDDNDTFWGYSAQNPMAGGLSNTLSSADRLDGEGGNDRIYAELSFEFFGTNGFGLTDIQPQLTSIEEIDIEARDFGLDFSDDFADDDITELTGNPFLPITVDAKEITDHVEIGSYKSDGDLKIENLTTLTEGGSARNTSEITVTMDHTDNFNSDNDASDLVVLFDNDYLLSGQTEEGFADFFLLDQDAELALKNIGPSAAEGRLDDLDKNGIEFRIDTDGDGDVDGDDDLIEVAFDDTLIVNDDINTHEEFRDALQDPLQALIDDGILPEGTTIELFDHGQVVLDNEGRNANQAVLDDGSRSDLIPAVRVELGNNGQVEPVGFSTPQTEVPPFNFFGRVKSEFEETDEPISIDIDLHKVGRGGEGGDLVVGGKADSTNEGIAGGIDVFNINVKGVGGEGADAKPSNVGSITSTLGALNVVNIATDPDFVDGDSFASLVVRNGFNGNLDEVDADGFLGNLTLGSGASRDGDGLINNVETLSAMGGGDITVNAVLNEAGVAYDYDTGAGDDSINILLDGDAVDYAGSELDVSTGGGDDSVSVVFDFDAGDGADDENNQLNQAILDNVNVETGSGDDTITIDSVGNANIDAGSGDDFINTSGSSASSAIWALNVDAARADAQGGFPTTTPPEDLPGEEVSLAYIGGATVTVTLSGAGVGADGVPALAAGGGIMAYGEDGAVAGDDGYESEVTIDGLINGNEYFGTQADINAAVLEAINDDPILGQLLTAEIGANNTLVVASTTSGAFEDIDLRVDIAQEVQGDDEPEDWDAVEAEAQQVFSNSSITIESLADANGGGWASLGSSADADAWYDGLSVADDDNSMAAGVGDGLSNLHTAGTASTSETDNVIDGGAGDDLIVLSTDAVALADPAFTPGDNNLMINGASNETIVLTGASFGDDTVMNFGVEGDGIDFLDFSAYLTSLFDQSDNADADDDSSDSDVLIPVTVEFNADDVEANEVAIVGYTDDTDETPDFDSLSASDIEDLFNTDDEDYDGSQLDANAFSVKSDYDKDDQEQLIGDAKGVLMVENEDNDGEYKVFELTWSGDAEDADDVSANLLGSIDFGDSLDGLSGESFVGSDAYMELLDGGIGGEGGGDTGGGDDGGGDDGGDTGGDDVLVDLTGETEVTAVDGTAETFVLEFDSTSGNALSSDAVVALTGFDPAEDTLRFDDANDPAQDAATFLNGAGGAVVASNGFAGETTISFQDDNPNDAVDAAELTLVGITDATLGGTTPFFEVV